MEKIKINLKVGQTFTYRRRVFFYETDAGGIMNNTHLFKLFEEARTVFLDEASSMDTLYNEDPEGPTVVVRQTEATYKSPAFFNDILILQLELSNTSKAKFQISYQVSRESDGIGIATGSVTLAAVKKNTMRPLGIEYAC